jgi:hypothetical protein
MLPRRPYVNLSCPSNCWIQSEKDRTLVGAIKKTDLEIKEIFIPVPIFMPLT